MAAISPSIDEVFDLVSTSELGEKIRYRVPVTAYPTRSGVLLINSPGTGELKDGRNYRWTRLALHLQQRGLCTTITYNAPRPDFQVQLECDAYSHQGASWHRLLMESLTHVLDWSLENAAELCGNSHPRVCLSGFSSGGSAAGAVAWRYPQVRRLLLLSTYDSVGDGFYEGISKFSGDIYVVYGGEDTAAGLLARVLGGGPLAARSFQAREVPNCKHRFEGEANTKILYGAFLWALEGLAWKETSGE